MLQFLRNDGNLAFTDVTDTTLHNAYLGKNDPGKANQYIDVNGDGFLDIVTPGGGTWLGNGTLDKSWSNEVFINTGNGKFVSVMWDQFTDLHQRLGAAAQAAGHNLYYPLNIHGDYYPYVTPDGRIGFATMTSGFADSSGAYREIYFTIESETPMSTGPGGINPALQGAAGFNEAFYLTEYADAKAAVAAGTYATGLAHYLAVGRAAGHQAFAKNAHVQGSAGNDQIVLREGNEWAFGLAGNDVVVAGAGNDRIDGGEGVDQMLGGAGDDLYIVDRQDDVVFENVGEGVDSVEASANFYLYANIENLTLTGSAGNFGVGNGLANIITGNGGGNLLLGGGGNDTIRGAAGNDQLYGEAGVDTMYGDAGIDYLIGGAGNDVLDGGTESDGLYGEDGDDTLIGGAGFFSDILVGGAGNDILRGDSGLGEQDHLDGGAGDDAYYVDSYADLTYEVAGGGTDTVHATINGTGYYLYGHVENLVLGGDTPFGVGNELANRLTGSAAANWLLGGGGNDTLNGKAGNDVLFGEGGADTFVFERGTGGDTVGDFTVGVDKIDLTAFGLTWQAVSAAMVDGGSATAINLGNGDFIVLNGVAKATLTQGDFILSGAAASDAVELFPMMGIEMMTAGDAFARALEQRQADGGWEAHRASLRPVGWMEPDFW